jgi:hypothetical protein
MTCRCERVGARADYLRDSGQRVGRLLVSEEVVERRAERIDVTARAGAGPLYLFEGRVMRRVADNTFGVRPLRPPVPLGEAEVQKDDLAPVGQL